MIGRRTDAEALRIVQAARDRFCGGPVGVWVSDLEHDLGVGIDALFGNRIEFREDGSGLLLGWGFRGEDRNDFTWRSVKPGEIEIRYQIPDDEEDPGMYDPDRIDLVRFDFFVATWRPVPHLYQVDHPFHEGDFWFVVGPLVEVARPDAPG